MILFDHVTKAYPNDKRPALDNVSFHIEANEFVFLVGKSGAGKSTLIKMITKEERPDDGKIIIGGIDLDYVKNVTFHITAVASVLSSKISNYFQLAQSMKMLLLLSKLLA